MFSNSYFLNLKGPGFCPFWASAAPPLSDVETCPLLVDEFLGLLAGEGDLTVDGGGGSEGRLTVITEPRGRPPRGPIPNLNGPSGIGSEGCDECGFDAVVADAFLSTLG